MTNDHKTTLWRGFGQYLREVRERLNYSQEGIAKRVGLTRQQWNRLENGLSGTKRETVINIAKQLNLDVSEVLSKSGFGLPENRVLPSELAIIDYDGFDEQDLEEIAEYINFKRAQKEKKVNK